MCCVMVFTCSKIQVWKDFTCWHSVHFVIMFKQCSPMSVKSTWAGVWGCLMHLAGFDGFSPLCSGARWPQSTEQTYWSQSESEAEQSLSPRCSKLPVSLSIIQFMKENCQGRALTKGISGKKKHVCSWSNIQLSSACCEFHASVLIHYNPYRSTNLSDVSVREISCLSSIIDI